MAKRRYYQDILKKKTNSQLCGPETLFPQENAAGLRWSSDLEQQAFILTRFLLRQMICKNMQN